MDKPRPVPSRSTSRAFGAREELLEQMVHGFFGDANPGIGTTITVTSFAVLLSDTRILPPFEV